METYKKIDMKSWDRANLYKSFMEFQNPFMNVSTEFKIENLYKYAKQNNISFFQLTVYAILNAVNSIKEFRYRILNGIPVEFERIGVLTPISIGEYKYKEIVCDYAEPFEIFRKELHLKIENAKSNAENSEIADFSKDHIKSNMLISCIPTIEFQCLTSPICTGEDIPVLTYGKMLDGSIPLSIMVNHAFVDGYHLATLFEKIQYNFNNPQTLL